MVTDGVASEKRKERERGDVDEGWAKTTLVMQYAAVAYARVATTIFERVTTRTSCEAARGRALDSIEKIRRRRRRTNGDDERLVEKIRETTRVIRSAAALNFLFST